MLKYQPKAPQPPNKKKTEDAAAVSLNHEFLEGQRRRLRNSGCTFHYTACKAYVGQLQGLAKSSESLPGSRTRPPSRAVLLGGQPAQARKPFKVKTSSGRQEVLSRRLCLPWPLNRFFLATVAIQPKCLERPWSRKQGHWKLASLTTLSNRRGASWSSAKSSWHTGLVIDEQAAKEICSNKLLLGLVLRRLTPGLHAKMVARWLAQCLGLTWRSNCHF